MIHQNEGQAAAQDYLKQHLQYSSLRKIAIEKAMQSQDYGQVIDLVIEGESKDKDLRGFWYSVYPRILEKLEAERFVNEHIYPRILIEEGDLLKLLKYIQDRPSRIEAYYKHLLPAFKGEVYALFIRYIEQSAVAASNSFSSLRNCWRTI